MTGIQSFETFFAPKARLWERWQAHDVASTESIDHSAWDRLLKRYLARDSAGANRFA